MFMPSGNGEKTGPMLTISNPSVLVSAFNRAENGEGYTLRIYECAGKESSAIIDIPALSIHEKIALNPFELRTLHLDEKNHTLCAADIPD